MKKITYVLLILFMTSGCKDFLDEQPLSQISESNFYKTSDDFNNAVMAGYSLLQNRQWLTASWVMMEVRSDNTYIQDPSGFYNTSVQIDEFIDVSDNPQVANMWQWTYIGISRSNAILDKIDQSAIPDALKSQYAGEALFLRAYHYFNLVRLFGAVPLVTKFVNDPNDSYKIARSAEEEVYGQIISDLTAAEEKLPESYNAANLGRATRWAAKAMLGKVYLTRKDYANAAAKLREVMQSGKFALLANYADVFRATNKNHAESIFDIQFKANGLGNGSPFSDAWAPQGSGSAVTGSPSSAGGQGANNPTVDMANAYEAGDVRKDISMRTSWTRPNGTVVNDRYVRKFSSPPAFPLEADDNFPILRYADVVLMYAEAVNESGDPNQAATYLNQVRTRAKLDPVDALSQPQMRLALEQERRVELAFENHRWFDLLRTGRAIEVMTAKGFNLPEFRLLYPIPVNQINLYPDVLTQNPGGY